MASPRPTRRFLIERKIRIRKNSPTHMRCRMRPAVRGRFGNTPLKSPEIIGLKLLTTIAIGVKIGRDLVPKKRRAVSFVQNGRRATFGCEKISAWLRSQGN